MSGADGRTYIDCAYKEKAEAKALGAEWDAARRSWFVPAGIALAPFSRWLPAAAAKAAAGPATTAVAPKAAALPTASRGIGLAALLGQVAGTLSKAFPETVWVRCEISEVRRLASGHLYLTLLEHDSSGREVAKTTGTLWAARAQKVVEGFCRDTGVDFAPGLKVLLEVRVRLTPRHGLALDVEGIDPSYTLGELEAKLRRIRQQLAAEGILGRNRAMILPGDYFRVIVISPEDGAGLGDFRVEAARLEHHRLCRFDYRSAIFQGDRASASLSARITAVAPGEADALVVIRGGGAVADLHWLSDLDIARALCLCPLPVIVGVGHERDRTLLDELACKSVGTPSKVIGLIEAAIRETAESAGQNFALIERAAQLALEKAAGDSRAALARVRDAAAVAVERAGQSVELLRNSVITEARRVLPDAARRTQALMDHQAAIAEQAILRAQARQDTLLAGTRGDARRLLAKAGDLADAARHAVTQSAGRSLALAEAALDAHRDTIAREAWRSLATAERSAEQAMAVTLGLGPERTLKRGFALAWAGGKPVGSRAEAAAHEILHIEFHDGKLPVKTLKET